MCLACAAVAAPEVAVIVGGYAAVRFGRPVARLREALGRGPEADSLLDESAQQDAALRTEAHDRVPVTPVP